MGFDEKQSMQLATTATMFQNIADKEISAGDAALFINSQLKAFRPQLSQLGDVGTQSMHVIDAVNETANNFAVGTNDLQLALSKTSSAMGGFGNSFEQTIGIITAGTEVMVGQPAKVARGWRTIGANIAAVAKDSKKFEAANGKVSISMRKQNGEIKNTYEFLTDLNKSWGNLTNEEKQQIGIQLAGKNHLEVFRATMDNFKTAVDATNTALNSNGSATKENAKALDSMEGRLQALRSAWEEFSHKMVDSDVVKKAMTSLTDGLRFLTTDTGQALVKTAVNALKAYAAFKLFTGLGGNLIGTVKNFKNLGNVMRGLFGARTLAGARGFGKQFNIVSKSLKGTGKRIDDTAKNFGRLGAAAGNATPAVGGLASKSRGLATVFAGGAVGWGLLGAAGVVAGLMALSKYLDPENQYGRTAKKLEEVKGKLSEVNDEILGLEKKRETTGLTAGEEQRLEILKQQRDILKQQIEAYDEIRKKQYHDKETKPDKKDTGKENVPRVLSKGAVGRAVSEQDIQATDKLTSALKAYNDAGNNASHIKREMAKAQEEVNIAERSGDAKGKAKALEKLGNLNEEYGKSVAKLPKKMEAVKGKLAEWKKEYGGIDKMPDDMKKSAKAVQKVVDAYDDLQGKAKKAGDESFAKSLKPKEYQEVTKDLLNMGTAIGVVKNKSGDVKNIDFTKFSNSMQAAGLSTEQTKEMLVELSNTNTNATVTIDGVEVANEDIESVLDFMDKLNGEDADATVNVDGSEVAVKDIGDVNTYLKLLNGKISKADLQVTGSEKASENVTKVQGALKTMPASKQSNLKVTGAEGASKKAQKLDKSVRSVPNSKTSNVKAKTSGGSKVDDLKGKVDAVPKVKNVLISVGASISGLAKKAMEKMGFASGTRNAPEGLSEVNEQGFEFIRDAKTGMLRVAGGGKRTITHLNQGDQVYTHAESLRMISDKDDIEVPQHKKGKKKKGGGKGAKKRAKALSKAQSAYNTKIDKYKNQYEAALKALQYKRDTKHISDLQYQREYNALYNRYNKLIKNTKPAVVKGKGAQVKRQTGLGTDARYDLGTSQADLRHEQKTKQIESLIEDTLGTGTDLTKALNAINAARKSQDISAEEQAEYTKQAYQRNADYNMQMYKNDKVTYANMRKTLDDYYKAGKLTAAEYYDYLDDLAETQLDKEKKRIEDKKKLNDDTYSLAKAFVERRISELEKENKEQEEQNDLVAKQNDLMKAQNKMVKVYREGKGFVYEKDTEAIKEATQALQEYKTEQKNPELEKWEKVQELFEDMEALAEIKELENKVGASATGLFGGFGTNLDAWTQWIKENLATGMGLESLADSMDDLTYYDDIFKFLQGADGTVSESQISSAISKYRFASGTDYVPRTGFARVSEQGYEIALLGQGDAVMPHDVSKNLMAWGAYSPIDFAKQSGGNGDITYNFDKLVLPNVANANDFIRELKQLPNKALQFGTSRS